MRLAALRDGTRDGQLVVVHPGGRGAVPGGRWSDLQAALDDWENAEPELRRLDAGLREGRLAPIELPLDRLAAPLPRTHEWLDASAYLSHVVLARRARGAAVPADLETSPLMYQGSGSGMLGPRDAFVLRDAAWGLDFEAELAVILGPVAEGTSVQDARSSVRLIMLANDWTLRNLVPDELAKGFGFIQAKPATAFSPFAVTPDELGSAWNDGRVHGRVRALLNGALMGDCESGVAMHFSFFQLIAHAARTRSLGPGTILGSGTVANADPENGSCCLVERRMRETLDGGAARTPYLKPGDCVQIEAAIGSAGANPFGAIEVGVGAPD